jgi:hypothetical protein
MQPGAPAARAAVAARPQAVDAAVARDAVRDAAAEPQVRAGAEEPQQEVAARAEAAVLRLAAVVRPAVGARRRAVQDVAPRLAARPSVAVCLPYRGVRLPAPQPAARFGHAMERLRIAWP